MKIRPTPAVLLSALLLSGCASLFKPPAGASDRATSASRDPWVEARASQLENNGLSAREAKGQAITEAALRGR
jgi:outer membrane murein-binding lipoprotein Lpp